MTLARRRASGRALHYRQHHGAPEIHGTARGLLPLPAAVLLGPALLAPLLLSGCYAGVAAIVTGVIAASGGGGTTTVNRPPAQPAIQSPERIDGTHVLIPYFLEDDRDGEVDVRVEWQPADGSCDYSPAADAPGSFLLPGGREVRSDGTVGIPVKANTLREATFVWNAGRDLTESLGRRVALVRVRITPSDRARKGAAGQEGEGAVSPTFFAGNDPPEIVSSVTQGSEDGVIPLTFKVADSTSDAVTFDVAYRVGANGERRSWWEGRMVLVGISPETPFDTAPEQDGGKDVVLFWDTRGAPETRTLATREIHVDITPRDAYESLESALMTTRAGPLTLDNNADPVVQIVDTASAPDRSFEIPIRFVARDEDAHPVNVILQWALQNEGFPPLPISEEPSAEDLAFLEELLSSDTAQAAEIRAAHHILSESRLSVTCSAERLESAALPASAGSTGILESRFLRARGLVTSGLLHRPPTQLRPTDLPEAPFGPDSGVFLVAREVWPSGAEPPAPPLWIESFDPRTSTATLSSPIDLLAGGDFQVEVNGGVVGLASSREGLVHTFVWDSARDAIEGEIPVRSSVRLRAVAVDTQAGEPSPESVHELESEAVSSALGLVTPTRPDALATGDVTGDGRDDLVVLLPLSPLASQAIVYEHPTVAQALLTPAGGRYAPTPDHVLATEGLARAAAIGDFDSDGRMDVVIAGESEGSAHVFLQNPDGLLGLSTDTGGRRTSSQILAAGTSPRAVAAGDVDGDGLDDLLIADTSGTTVNVFLQHGGSGAALGVAQAGNAPSLPDYRLSTEKAHAGSVVGDLEIGDLDGDEDNDLLVTFVHLANLRIFYQRSGLLGLPPEPLTPGLRRPDRVFSVRGSNLSRGVIADLNADGRSDLAAVDGQNGVGMVFLQRSMGELGLPADDLGRVPPDYWLDTSGASSGLGAADLNGDGLSDLVAVSAATRSTGIYLQGRSGFVGVRSGDSITFRPSQGLPLGVGDSVIDTGDINGDGHADLVLGTGTVEGTGEVTIHLQVSPGSLFASPTQTLVAEREPVVVSFAEINSDGRMDALALSRGAGKLCVYLQTLSGELPSRPSLALPAGVLPSSLSSGDIDGDGRNDVVLVGQTPDRGSMAVFAYRQRPPDADGLSFAAEDLEELMRGDGIVAALVGDVSGDGRNDIIVVNQSEDTASVLLQATDGSMSPVPAAVLRTGRNPVAAAIGDVNRDGLDDIVVVNRIAGTASVFLQRPGPEHTIGSVQEMGAPSLPDYELFTDGFPVFVAIGDVGDGTDGDVGNDGGGGSSTDNLAHSGGPSDVVIVNRGARTVTIYLQEPSGLLGALADGQGRRLPDQRLATGPGPEAAAIGDLDTDGRSDVLVVNTSSTPPVAGVYLQDAAGRLGIPSGGNGPALPNRELSTGAAPTSAAIRDYNGDGRADVIIANRDNGAAPEPNLSVYLAR